MLGPNGAGKTTTTEMLVGLRQPDAGIIKILGIDLKKQSADIKKRIGAQLQNSQTIQFPMMFLSGVFFPVEIMPAFPRSGRYALKLLR